MDVGIIGAIFCLVTGKVVNEGATSTIIALLFTSFGVKNEKS